MEQEKLNPYSPNRSTNPTEGASEWSIGIGYVLGLAIHVIFAISYLVWLNSRMHDLTPSQVDDGNIIGFAILFCAPIGAFLGALAADLTNRLTSARAGYLAKLNVSGTLAHSDEADMYKATGFATPEDVSPTIDFSPTIDAPIVNPKLLCVRKYPSPSESTAEDGP